MHTMRLATRRAQKGSLAMLIFVYAREIVLTGALIGVCWLLVKSSRDLAMAMREHKERD